MKPPAIAASATALALATAVAFPVPASAQGAAAPRQKVGLVLGGGGARGAAHIGILEVLEENRVIVDCVAGTSMGALVGGAYAAGVSPGEMKEAVRRTDWTTMFDDSAGREFVDQRHKQLDDRFFSALEFGVKKDGLHYREGAVAGEKIKLFFNQLVREDLGERTIEELAIPLTLIATDIGTGERVPMRNGNLTSAMRASMSVPGAIAPVVRNGRKLVDGGLVDNVPIGEVKERCSPDVVIAINVGSPMMKAEEVTGVVSVVGQMVNLLAEQNVTQSLKLLGPRDIYVRPEIEITAADFGRQLEAMETGRKAALAVVDRLRPLGVSPEAYRRWRAGVRLSPPPQPPVIDEIRVAPTRFISVQAEEKRLRQKEGQPLDSEQLAKDLVLIYSQGDLQSLDYAVQKERDKTILKITPVEKAWGPDYLRFGLNLSSDLSSEATYNLRALYRKTWLNSFGGEWLTALQVGSEQRLGTEFYQPLDYRQISFVQPYVNVRTDKTGLYFDGDRLAEYRLLETQAGIYLGANLGVYGQVRAAWLGREVRGTLETGSPIFPNVKQRIGGARAELAIDTQDQAFFPSRGMQANVTYFEASHTSEGLSRYGRAEARFAGAWSPGDLILLGGLEGGQSIHGTLPLADIFALGGPRRLGGFAPNQILGDQYLLGRLEAQYRLTKPIPLLGLSVLAGVAFETGRMQKPITEPNLTGWLQSYGVYLASNTAFGPIYLGYSYAKKGDGRFYLFIGTP